MNTQIVRALLLGGTLFTTLCCSNTTAEEGTMNDTVTTAITITTGEGVIRAKLNDSPAARDFIAQLPLTVTLDDYASTEKVVTLPSKLSTEDAPSGFDPSIGSITYYAPWGNIAIFYRDFGYANGLVDLGTITSGIELLQVEGAIDVTIDVEQ